MKSVSSVNQVKKNNINLIKKALKSIPSGTKNTVAGMTGLSIATCNTILNELSETQEILEVEGTAVSAGRPPKTYRFNELYSYVCCIFPTLEDGVRHLNYAVTDLLGNIILESYIIYDQITLSEIKQVLHGLFEKEPKINTISIGIPGYYYSGQIESCGIDELNSISLVAELENEFHCNVFIENDLNAMTYGFYYYDDEVVERNKNLVMIAFFKETRVGAGIVINGQILHGNTEFAGEIAHLRYPNGEFDHLINGSSEDIALLAETAVENLSAIVNPALIVFMGDKISQDIIPEIHERVAKYIPEKHIPKLIYGRDFKKYYIAGLYATAIEKTEN